MKKLFLAGFLATLLVGCARESEQTYVTETSSTSSTATTTETELPVPTDLPNAAPDAATGTAPAAPNPAPIRSPQMTPSPMTPPPMTVEDPSSIRRVSPGELETMVAEGSAVIVDVRAPSQFAESHITGSISIPYPEIPARAGELPKDKWVVAYCT